MKFDPERVAAVGTRLRGLVAHREVRGRHREGGRRARRDRERGARRGAGGRPHERAQAEAAELNARREGSLSTAGSPPRARPRWPRRRSARRRDAQRAQQRVRALGGDGRRARRARPAAPIAGTVVERHVAPASRSRATSTPTGSRTLAPLDRARRLRAEPHADPQGRRVSVRPSPIPTKAIPATSRTSAR